MSNCNALFENLKDHVIAYQNGKNNLFGNGYSSKNCSKAIDAFVDSITKIPAECSFLNSYVDLCDNPNKTCFILKNDGRRNITNLWLALFIDYYNKQTEVKRKHPIPASLDITFIKEASSILAGSFMPLIRNRLLPLSKLALLIEYSMYIDNLRNNNNPDSTAAKVKWDDLLVELEKIK